MTPAVRDGRIAAAYVIHLNARGGTSSGAMAVEQPGQGAAPLFVLGPGDQSGDIVRHGRAMPPIRVHADGLPELRKGQELGGGERAFAHGSDWQVVAMLNRAPVSRPNVVRSQCDKARGLNRPTLKVRRVSGISERKLGSVPPPHHQGCRGNPGQTCASARRSG
jgi:hypothetical protein